MVTDAGSVRYDAECVQRFKGIKEFEVGNDARGDFLALKVPIGWSVFWFGENVRGLSREPGASALRLMESVSWLPGGSSAQN